MPAEDTWQNVVVVAFTPAELIAAGAAIPFAITGGGTAITA